MNPRLLAITFVLAAGMIVALVATYSGDWLVRQGISKLDGEPLEIGLGLREIKHDKDIHELTGANKTAGFWTLALGRSHVCSHIACGHMQCDYIHGSDREQASRTQPSCWRR